MPRTVVLSAEEISVLDRQDPSTRDDGGWQGLLVGLQSKLDRASGMLVLDGASDSSFSAVCMRGPSPARRPR